MQKKDTLYYLLTVKEVIRETADAITIHFNQPDENKLSYKPGQYLTLITQVNGEKVRRAYSLSSSPLTDSLPAVTVKRVDSGKMSRHLVENIKAGDVIEVMEPMGIFTSELKADNYRHVIYLEAEVGLHL
jgi:ring-1,2-phenylacetyl-CoA epoxidase subunit PaaE